ncbi:ABC transporter substrate-binding protein [Clostridium sp. MSJ-4]|uniref:ABC transporter substrate-binding protein n=1 Tax=Clostridium simiarum TaxID=2841506 RepID=A0ABS6F547_9CLOT|nr:ABC transporter substrate-binding protein [Clostridium simiarum]MBU5592925.1 ABC transporter substrate-binding protein [Clostridium simiarum]
MKKKISMLLAGILSVSLLAGCQGGSNGEKEGEKSKGEVAQGVEGDTIKVGTIAPTSGGVAVVGIPVTHGMEAYFKMINEEGGVNGKKIELVVKDDGFKPDVALQKAEELVEKDKVFAIVGQTGTPGALSCIDYLSEKGIPAVYQGTGASKLSQVKGNYFPVQPNYIFEGSLMAKYMIDDLKANKIAVIYENNDIGKEGLEGIKGKLKKMGKESALVTEVPYNPADVDFSAHVQKLSENTPDVTVIYGNAKPAAGIANEAKKQGFKTQFLASYIVADITLFQLAKDAWDGAITAAWVPDITDPNNAEAKKFNDTFKKYFPDETPNAYGVAGWVAAQVFTEGLKRVKGDLTWENYIKSMESLKDYSEGIAKGITYTEDRRNGVEKMYFMKAKYVDDKNFGYEKITDFISAE